VFGSQCFSHPDRFKTKSALKEAHRVAGRVPERGSAMLFFLISILVALLNVFIKITGGEILVLEHHLILLFSCEILDQSMMINIVHNPC